jgi:hypothetical protein
MTEENKNVIDFKDLPVVDFDAWTRQFSKYSLKEIAEKIQKGELGVAEVGDPDSE